MKITSIAIPNGMAFSDLKLSRATNGDMEFDSEILRDLFAVNRIDEELFFSGPDENLATLLIAWYQAALEMGEPKNPIMEDIAEEMRIENELGDGNSHPPGTA